MGFPLTTLGKNVQWLKFLTLALPIVPEVVYYRLAKTEEKDAEEKFGRRISET
jgi:hypothetical protein